MLPLFIAMRDAGGLSGRTNEQEYVVTRGLISDSMRNTAYKEEALAEASKEDWRLMAGEPFVSEAGWYFKTLAVQEVGKTPIVYQRRLSL